MIVLDTHVLIWMDADRPELGRKARQTIRQAWREREVAVSAISFGESAMLHERGRISLPSAPLQWRAELLAAGLIEIPLDGATVVEAVGLSGLHKDPADRFIAAASSRLKATLLTADGNLLKWKGGPKKQNAAR